MADKWQAQSTRQADNLRAGPRAARFRIGYTKRMPPTTERNHYETLGVTRNASLDDIKKRYRELARQFHPDVNPDNPQAAQQFAEMSAAYKILSDTGARANYDAEILLRERQAEQAAARARQATQNAATAARTITPPRTVASSASPAVIEAQKIAERARAARQHGRFVEARSLGEQAIRTHRRNALAYEVLGDVYRLQGKADDAMNMYTMALQLNPANHVVRQHFERLVRTNGGGPGPTAERVFFDNSDRSRDTSARPGPYRGSPAPPTNADKTPLLRFLIGFVGYAGTIVLILYTALYPGDAPRIPFFVPLVSEWNVQILTMLAVCGGLLGMTMAISGAINRIDDELILTGASGRGAHLPVGLIVLVLALINFYFAAAVYVVVALFQESFTKTMQRVFLAAFLATVGLALAYAPGQFQVFLWGGNVVFLSLVIGWLVGDFLRPTEY